MTRSTVKNQLMANEKQRNVSLQKRKASLIKKINEMKILCEVDACLVVYEKNNSPPQVWPSPSEAQRLMQKFQTSRIVGASAMMDQKAFLQKSITRMKIQLAKEKEKNLRNSMVRCAFNNKTQEDLEAFKSLIDSEIRTINTRINNAYVKGKENAV